ncbi:MAG: hypothetical protein IJL04_06105 [Bacteroidales bacterium]|nr:hypothetical protein [Bacteroidales bacterium]
MQMWRSMQHIGWTVLLGLVIAGCSRYDDIQAMAPSSTSSALVAVDSLMWRQPDSALALLLPWFDSCGDVSGNVSTTFDLHYAHLLLSELLYKNYYEQTNRAELLQSEAYFDSISLFIDNHPHIPWSHCGPSFRECGTQSPQTKDDLAFLAARAHYMDGVGHYERDSLVPACREYLKALGIMEGRFDEKDLTGHKALFMAYAFSRLTDVYSDLYLHEQTIYFSSRSLEYHQRLEVPSWYTARMLCEIGAHYNMMDRLDSADCYYKKAKSVLCDTSILMYRDICAHQASIECKKNNRPDVALRELYFLLLQSESLSESMVRKADIGEIYYNGHEYDSAFKYLDEVFRKAASTGSKKQAAEWLVDICKELSLDDKAYEYACFLVPFSNLEENLGETKSQLSELYTSYKQDLSTRQRRVEKKQQEKLFAMFFVGLLSVIVVTTALYRRNKRKRLNLEKQIESERYAHQLQQAALSGKLKRSRAAAKELERTKQKVFPSLKEPIANSIDNYLDEPICRQILEACTNETNPIKSSLPVSAYAHVALDNAQKAQLKEAAIRHYGLLFDRLKVQYPKLKEKDFQYIYLCLLGLDNTQIAALQQHSTSTIWEREKRLQKIFGSDDKIGVILHGFLIH